jgi:hypothetical protein
MDRSVSNAWGKHEARGKELTFFTFMVGVVEAV